MRPTPEGRERLLALMQEEARFRDRRSFGSDGNHAAALGVSRRTVIRWKCQLESEGKIERDGYHVWSPRCRTVRWKFPNVTQRLRRSNLPPSGLRNYRYGRTNARGCHAKRGEMSELERYDRAMDREQQDAFLDKQLSAQDVLRAVCDTFSAKGIPIPSRHKGMIARQSKELLGDGFDYETVVVAAVVSLKRGQPQNLHFIASDLVLARAGERMTRREYEKALQDEMELR